MYGLSVFTVVPRLHVHHCRRSRRGIRLSHHLAHNTNSELEIHIFKILDSPRHHVSNSKRISDDQRKQDSRHHPDTMQSLANIVLAPATKLIIGILCFLPIIAVALLDIFNHFFSSFTILDHKDNLWLAKLYGLIGFSLGFVLPSAYECAQALVKWRGRLSYEAIPPAQDPRYTENDVTVIMPILGSLRTAPEWNDLRRRLNTILEVPFHHIILAANHIDMPALLRLAYTMEDRRISTATLCSNRFRDTPPTNRQLMAGALPELETPIAIFVSEYCSWPAGIISWLLAPFEDDLMGAVGTLEHIGKLEDGSAEDRYWNTLIAQHNHDNNQELLFAMGTGNTRMVIGNTEGGTCAFRTEILKKGRMLLDLDSLCNAYGTRWETHIQYGPECFVHTTSPYNHEDQYKVFVATKFLVKPLT